MSLELTCKLLQLLPEQTGNGKNGPWVKQDFIVETIENYPKKVCMSAWGDQVKQIQAFPVNSSIKTSIRIESREYNGRWYTDVKPWKIEAATGAPAANGYAAPQNAASSYSNSPEPIAAAGENDDLPF